MGRRGRSDCNMGGSGGLQEVTYAVPADKCGLVIGKGKETFIIYEVISSFKHLLLLLLCSAVLYMYCYKFKVAKRADQQ